MKNIKEDAPTQEVLRGISWTAVVSKRCGLASTLSQAGCSHGESGGKEGCLTEMTALELAHYCLHGDMAKISLGIASINSLIEVDSHQNGGMEGLQIIRKLGKEKNISVIGHFPHLHDLKREARNLWILEKNPGPGDYPEAKGRTFLPQSDIVVITSTTLINNTLPGILELCREGSVKMLLGPTTPLSDVLFDYGIDILAGSIVTDNNTVLRSVSEGASFLQLKKNGGVSFVSIIKDYNNISRRLT